MQNKQGPENGGREAQEQAGVTRGEKWGCVPACSERPAERAPSEKPQTRDAAKKG